MKVQTIVPKHHFPNFINQYLSSKVYVEFQPEGSLSKIQGPSVETWMKYRDKNTSGDDRVPSVHCKA